MANAVPPERRYTLDDGLGVRSIHADISYGAVEFLDLTPALAVEPAIEHAIRERAKRYALVDAVRMTPVRRIDRESSALRIVADAPEGRRLSQLLADLEFGNDVLGDEALLELAWSVISAVADLHRVPGIIAHGAINPSHIIVRSDGSATLTDAVFGGALEALQRNREQLWREFTLALPTSASMHRFDQRADVTQLGAVVLAIALRRPLRSDEYPRAVGDLVLAATPAACGPHASALRMWLQQALQLHPRSVFASAVDARQMFAEAVRPPTKRRAPAVSNRRAS